MFFLAVFCIANHPLAALLFCRYLMGEFVKNPIACLTLASYLITNTGGLSGGALLLIRHISRLSLSVVSSVLHGMSFGAAQVMPNTSGLQCLNA
jgi:hypothetical protein